jgi:hypothetical protein
VLAFQIGGPNDSSKQLGVACGGISLKGQPFAGPYEYLHTLTDTQMGFDPRRAVLALGGSAIDLDASLKRAGRSTSEISLRPREPSSMLGSGEAT